MLASGCISDSASRIQNAETFPRRGHRVKPHRTTKDPENYTTICVTVDLGDEPKTAWTYLGLREAMVRCEREHPGTTCDAGYADTVLAGAESIGVPDPYLEVLREVLKPP